jgi:hypothetical protein
MPINVKIIHTKDFIKTTATGILDFEASKQSILDIASHITQPGEYDVLVDTRAAEATLSITDLYELGQSLADHPALHQSKIGILVPERAMDQAAFFETVAVNRGFRIKAFTNFEQAITWLVLPREVPR